MSQQVKFTPEAVPEVEAALGVLEKWQVPCGASRAWFETAVEEMRRQPTEEDMLWPFTPPEMVGEHLSIGNDRPTLSCALVTGRAYSLTPGQRDYIRDHYNMTPAKLVKVIELAFYPGGKYIRRVTLVSEEHIDPRRRAMVVKLSIDNWGRFCTEAKKNDEDRQADVEVVRDGDKPSRGPKKEAKSVIVMKDLMSQYGID